MEQDILEIIKLQRKIKYFSQNQVAKQINITQSHYAKIENGKIQLTFSVFLKLIEVLELEPEQVLPIIYNKPIHEFSISERNLLAFKKEIIEEIEKKISKLNKMKRAVKK